MNYLRKICALMVALMITAVLVLPVCASTYSEHEGLQVVVAMDKEAYDPGEPVTATITVTNTNSYPVGIANLEQLIPDGYVLAEGSEVSLQDIEIQAGEVITLQVTFKGAPEPDENGQEDGDFFSRLLYGETWGISNLLLAVLAAIAIGIFMLLT